MLTFADFFEQKQYDSPAGVEVFVADSTSSLSYISDELEAANVFVTKATTLEQVSALIDSLHTAAMKAHSKGAALSKETFLFLNSKALNKSASETTLLKLEKLNEISRKVKLNILSFMP